MREILFRGKRFDNDEWIYWNRYGRLTDINGEPTKIEINTSALRPYAFYINELPVIREETVGQYTGFTDKNDKRIFEGDIMAFCKGATRPFEIRWDGIGWKMFTADGKRIKDSFESGEIRHMQKSEVIGNKWDTPELLEMKK